jgi:hypothetical protein
VAKNARGLRHHAAAPPPGPGPLSDPRAQARRSTASRAARTAAIVGVVALAGATWALWDHASSPTATTPSPTERISLAPLPPLPIWWKSLTGPQYTVVTARRGQPVRVGIHLGDGRNDGYARGDYVVSQVRIEVLPVGVHPGESVPGGGRLEQGTLPSVRRLVLNNLPSSTNRDVTVLFDGTDDRGRPLPAGRYEVGFFLATTLTKAHGWEPAGSSNGLSGLLVTVNYLG